LEDQVSFHFGQLPCIFGELLLVWVGQQVPRLSGFAVLVLAVAVVPVCWGPEFVWWVGSVYLFVVV